MLEHLTKDQETLLLQIRDQWLTNFFSLQFDEDKARRFVAWLYQLIHNDTPLTIIIDSPLACQLAVPFITNLLTIESCQVGSQVESQVRNQVGSQVIDQVRNQVRSQVGSQVGSQVRNQVWNQVRNQVESQVIDQVRNQVGSQVGSQVRSQVESQVGSQVWNQVWNQVRNQVGSQVIDQVRNQVESQVESQVIDQVRNQVESQVNYESFASYGDISDYGWTSFYVFFAQLGIVQHALFEEWIDFISCNIFSLIQLEHICIISRPPIKIYRDNQNRLHAIDGAAIIFGDGYEQHYVHGIYFAPEIFAQFFGTTTATAQEILALTNQEQKAAVIQEYGFQTIIAELHPQIIDTYVCISRITGQEKQYQLIKFTLDSLEHYLLAVEDHTSTQKYYLLVPPHSDCLAAVAWTFNVSKDDYASQLIMES